MTLFLSVGQFNIEVQGRVAGQGGKPGVGIALVVAGQVPGPAVGFRAAPGRGRRRVSTEGSQSVVPYRDVAAAHRLQHPGDRHVAHAPFSSNRREGRLFRLQPGGEIDNAATLDGLLCLPGRRRLKLSAC